MRGNTSQATSWPGLSRPSTSFLHDAEKQVVDGQDKPGHDVERCVALTSLAHIGGKMCGNFARNFARRSPLTSTVTGNVPLSFMSYGMQASTRIRLLKLPGRKSGSRLEAQAFWTMSISTLGSKRVHIAQSTWSSSPASMSSSTTTVHLPA